MTKKGLGLPKGFKWIEKDEDLKITKHLQIWQRWFKVQKSFKTNRNEKNLKVLVL
jgi:hypothetical protein